MLEHDRVSLRKWGSSNVWWSITWRTRLLVQRSVRWHDDRLVLTGPMMVACQWNTVERARTVLTHGFLSRMFVSHLSESSYCLHQLDQRNTELEDLWTGQLVPEHTEWTPRSAKQPASHSPAHTSCFVCLWSSHFLIVDKCPPYSCFYISAAKMASTSPLTPTRQYLDRSAATLWVWYWVPAHPITSRPQLSIRFQPFTGVRNRIQRTRETIHDCTDLFRCSEPESDRWEVTELTCCQHGGLFKFQ